MVQGEETRVENMNKLMARFAFRVATGNCEERFY